MVLLDTCTLENQNCKHKWWKKSQVAEGHKGFFFITSACNFDFPMCGCQAILLHNWDIINDKKYSYSFSEVLSNNIAHPLRRNFCIIFTWNQRKCWAITLHVPRDVQYYCSTPVTINFCTIFTWNRFHDFFPRQLALILPIELWKLLDIAFII